MAAKVAYTLNGSQPVSSNLLGTDPLFYTDFEYVAFEPKIKQRHATKWDDPDFKRMFTGFAEMPEELDLHELERLLGRSQYIRSMNTTDNLLVLSGVPTIELRQNCLWLNPWLSLPEAFLLCVREIRRAYRPEIDPLAYRPDDAILMNRVSQADLTVAMIRAATELKLTGWSTGYDYLYERIPGPLTAFNREVRGNWTTLSNGFASAAAFESWFLEDYCTRHDCMLIQRMLVDFGNNYYDRDLLTATHSGISELGRNPDGSNYLARHASTILADPIFTEVRGRSEANFLWFIKFERSFRETEKQL